MIDIVCFYLDFGQPYGPLMETMCASAKKVMDCRTVLLTDDTTADPQCFDEVIRTGLVKNGKTLCLDRARTTAWWMGKTSRVTLLCDPDLEFRHPVGFHDLDVGFGWRPARFDQPINSGLVIAKPRCPEFWTRYANTALFLPKVLHSWWCDQLAYNLMVGTSHSAGERFIVLDAKVRLFKAGAFCAPPEEAEPGCAALHFKGQRKTGPGWAMAYKSRDVILAC